MGTLDDILNDTPAGQAAEQTETTEAVAAQVTDEAEPVEQAAETAETTTGEEGEPKTDDRPRDEQGRFAAKGQPGKDAAPASEDGGPIPVKALMAEREKRQRAEQELAQLRQAQQQTQQQKRPDFWENPDRFRQDIEQVVERRITGARLSMSEQMARSAYQDFDEVMPVFEQLVQQNPMLAHQMIQSQHPGEFAYQTAKRAMAMQEIGDPMTYRERLKAQLLEEMKATGAGQQTQQTATQPSIPTSLAGARNVGSRSGPAYAGAPSLDDILNRKAG